MAQNERPSQAPVAGLVSVITPVHNGRRFLAQTIQSVIAQDYASWEMLIVDDGSTDGSAKIADSWAQKDHRVRVIRQKNGGSSNARNHGIREARGQYIALLDADDLWEPTFLSEQIAFMAQNNAACVYASYRRIDQDSQECLRPLNCRPYVTVREMRVTNFIGCLTGLYDCSAHGKVYLHEELKSVRDDYAYWYDIVSLCGTAYGNPRLLARYRVLKESTTGRKHKLVQKQFWFYRRYLHQGPLQSLFNTLYWGITGVLKFSR